MRQGMRSDQILLEDVGVSREIGGVRFAERGFLVEAATGEGWEVVHAEYGRLHTRYG